MNYKIPVKWPYILLIVIWLAMLTASCVVALKGTLGYYAN